MSPPRGTYSASAGFKATLWFKNSGATCTLIVDNVPIEGVSGPSHTPVGVGSLSGAVAYPPMVLANGDRAYASVSIGSISTASFKKTVREHGSSCVPKYADGIEVVSNPAVRGDSWPSHYFALAERVPICTKDYFNVAAGVIQKLLTPSQTRQAAKKGETTGLIQACKGADLAGAFAHSDLYAGGAIVTFAITNVGTSTCRLGGYPKLLGIRSGHEYPLSHVAHGTQEGNLYPATLAPRMSGAFVLDMSLGCNANVYPLPVVDRYTGVVILLPNSHGHVRILGVPLDVPCGLGESQLGWAKGFVFN
jgi:hypothetical protein